MEDRFAKIVRSNFQDSIDLKNKIINSELLSQIETVGSRIIDCMISGNKILFAGNGGSFADSQHLAAEFVSRFLFDRGALPGLALGTNNSNLSAVSNDYGYQSVFSREIEALGCEGDIFIPITTSGNSPNLIEAVITANNKGLKVVALTGESGGKLDAICECLKVPSIDVPRIQECHILIGHILCQIAEDGMFKPINKNKSL